MNVRCIWEHNGNDSILYAEEFTGAFTRGESLQVAKEKMPREMREYLLWRQAGIPQIHEAIIVQEQVSELQIRDADSDVLFDSERKTLTRQEYEALKMLSLKSAADFLTLYCGIPDKQISCLPPRRTFYGQVPRTAEEIYLHTKNVNAYYFAEIGVEADNEGSILECRERGFQLLEQIPYFLESEPVNGSYGEWWSLRKVLRRFLWHDRIHARAMYRMAVKTFATEICNPFCFDKGDSSC